jgi:hypothetical protein
MKLLRCNGRSLEVRDVGPVINGLAAARRPIKLHGVLPLEEEQAEEWIDPAADRSAKADHPLKPRPAYSRRIAR